ncbi:VWA domain protein [Luminiphilus syltensis NOR5-1B]|uniref:VWA domain protein n=1 Tax=Luminiphilus syltensis NOR5-1B TaxID=565045 RepID=B8KST3_9GAMM|nr:VWA domain-containing protein [Luminiphilus syltensis]EED36279.1 VWA domain protein [Luminiphilus syltensis NOR5-1B]
MTSAGDQLLSFIRFLRGQDIPISPADSMDAVRVAGLLGYTQRDTLKHGLASVLAKSEREAAIYNRAFDRFFSTEIAVNPNAASTPDTSTGDGDGGSGDKDAANTDLNTFKQLQTDYPEAMNTDQATLAEALLRGEASTVALSIEAAATAVQLNGIKTFTQRGQYTRRMLDAIGEGGLRGLVIALETASDPRLPLVQQWRQVLRERIRDRVERAYLVNAGGATEELLDDALKEVRLGNVAPHQIQRMKKLMARLARKLAARHGQRRQQARRGQLHVPATLRRSLPTDGIPFQTRWRRTRRRRPQLLAICDVSGSVATYAKFLLMFLYTLQDVLPRTRSFAFSGKLGEVSDLFAQLPIEDAIDRVNLDYGGATDYARAFSEFSQLALQDINRNTTVVILGDARNSNSDPRLDLLAEIKARCRQLIWLNPEPRSAWGTRDSEMLPVIRHCHTAAECNNLKHLERIVDKLLADTKRP